MTGPARAIVDKSSAIDATAPLQLAHTEAAIAHMRSDVVALGPLATTATPAFDIAAARMRDLAARLADARQEMEDDDDDDAMLRSADAEIAPVSLAAITGLRAFRATETADDIVVRAVTPAAPLPSHDVSIADAPELIGPPSPDDAVPTTAGIGIGYRLSDLAPTVPLRLAETPREDATSGQAIPADTEVVTEIVTQSVAEVLPPIADDVRSGQLLQRLDQMPGFGAPAPQDQIPTDIRLVDLIRRQQVLLEQLNSYPGAQPALASPAALEPEAPAAFAPAAEPFPSPTLPLFEAAAEPASPPPLPVSRGKAQEDEPAPYLPERSPIIIERARAERAGRYGSSTPAPPSALPAFAAGLVVALAAAGTLFYLL
jgi:hypothetical protein